MSSFWFLFLFMFIQCSQAEFRATRLSTAEIGDEVVFTLNYVASAKPEAIWRRQMYALPDEYSNDFDPSTGTGVTVLTVDRQRTGNIHVTLFEHCQDVMVTYSPRYFRWEGARSYDLPDLELWSPLGDHWVYDSGVPFNASVRFTKIDGNYDAPRAFWNFVGVDGVSNHPELEVASSYDQYTNVTEPVIVTRGSYLEGTAIATLNDKRGVVIVGASWVSSEYPFILLQKVMTIREMRQSGPFPPGFIGVNHELQFTGGDSKMCVQGVSCLIRCVAVGYDIKSLEMMKTAGDNKIQVSSSWSFSIFTFTVFDVYPQTDEDFTRYTCRAESSGGTIAETNILVVEDTSEESQGQTWT